MATIELPRRDGTAPAAVPWWAWSRLQHDRNWLGLWFMVPAAAFLLLFLTYPLGLGIWLSVTDAKIGRPGEFVGLDNFEWLYEDPVFWLSVFNTFLYTIVASVAKFALGLYLAIGFGYGLAAEVADSESNVLFCVILLLSILHFWYDGFVWSVRRKQIS